MERLLLYLAFLAAVLMALTAAKLKPQPDYCGEARRLVAAALAVNQSKGWITDTFLIDEGLKVDGLNDVMYHQGCNVMLKIRIDNTNRSLLPSDVPSGRVRLTIALNSAGEIVFLRR